MWKIHETTLINDTAIALGQQSHTAQFVKNQHASTFFIHFLLCPKFLYNQVSPFLSSSLLFGFLSLFILPVLPPVISPLKLLLGKP